MRDYFDTLRQRWACFEWWGKVLTIVGAPVALCIMVPALILVLPLVAVAQGFMFFSAER